MLHAMIDHNMTYVKDFFFIESIILNLRVLCKIYFMPKYKRFEDIYSKRC